MKCENCKSENPNGAKFCRSCGTKFKQVAKYGIMTKIYAVIYSVSLLMAIYSFVAREWRDYNSQPYFEYCDYCGTVHEMGHYVSVSDPFGMLSDASGYRYSSAMFDCPYYDYPYSYGMSEFPTSDYVDGLLPFQVLFSLVASVSGGLLYYEWRKKRKI